MGITFYLNKPLLEVFETKAAFVEKYVFNLSGYIPGLRDISSPLRWASGALQVLLGSLEAIYRLACAFFYPFEKKIYMDQFSKSVELVCQGGLNILRAKIEEVSILTAPLCIVYDFYIYRFTYAQEKIPHVLNENGFFSKIHALWEGIFTGT